MKDLIELNLEETAGLIKKGEITCEELMSSTLSQINKYDNIIESYISLYDEEILLKQAKNSDRRWKNNEQRSILEGIPVAVKDIMHCIGINTTCASRILENYSPSFDATAIGNLKNKGGIITGKTNLDEFAMGSTSETSALKRTINPWNPELVPGGSSGGSAAAVSGRMSTLALGSDTGGSVRQPASFCGVVGIKPTYGLISRYGLVAYASSLDQIGVFSRDTYGASALLTAIAGYDYRDSTSLNVPLKDYTETVKNGIKGMKIAVFPEFYQEGIAPDIKQLFLKSLDTLKELGAKVDEISFDAVKYIISTYYFIATAEACSNLERYDGVKYGLRDFEQPSYDEMLFYSRSAGFGKEVKKRILLGNFVLSSGYYDEYYKKAQKVRRYIMEEMKKIFKDYDIIATPTTPDTAFKFDECMQDPLKMYLMDITTALPNLTGTPAVSVPCGLSDEGMPAGLQLIGGPLAEDKILRAAYSFEKALNLNLRPDIEALENVEIKRGREETESSIKSAAVKIYSKELIDDITKTYNKEKPEEKRVLLKDLKNHIGKKVRIKGWIHRINSLGGIEFYILRDRSGMTQLVLEGKALSDKLRFETVIEAEGMVTKEQRSAYGNIEVKVSGFEIKGNSDQNLPINISGSLDNITLPTILDNRQLSIRNPRILKVFKIQSEIVRLYSEYLRNNDFTEIKSPKIISSGTEGGSNIFELKYFDRSAFLAQSPQFYKQIMVGSGFERVFEIGPVFRAEMHDTVRHLNEYTSLDFEMGFIRDEQDVIDMQEGLIKHIFSNIEKNHKDILDEFKVNIKIPDKIPRIHFLKALEISEKFGVKDMDGDISPEGEKVLCRYFEEERDSSFVYIIGYPVKKRPMYTMPDERLPGYTRSFDLLFKGLEITTGGQRIHDYEMLRNSIISSGANPDDFKHYLAVFQYGMPPHGGLGMGLERITMKLLDLKNIREATLFPRDRSRLDP